MAGMESTAKITSEDSTTTSTANSGVARRLPFLIVNSFWPSYSVVDGTTLFTIRRMRLSSGWTSSWVGLSSRMAVKSRNAPKT